MRSISLIAAVLILLLFACSPAAVDAQQKTFKARKIEVDTNYDGKIDRIEHYDRNGQILKVEVDTDGDGKIDEWITYKDGEPAKGEKDTNGDGKPDVWMEY